MTRAGADKANLNRDNASDDRQPEFSPSCAQIVFARPGYGIFTMTATGAARRQISSGGFDLHPDW